MGEPRPTNKDVLCVEEISLNFGGLSVLDRVTFTVPEEALVALVGPNGAGKSSLLNCISGIYRPRSGRILMNGRDITRLAARKRVRVGISRTFQHVELFPGLSVVDNLLLARHSLMRQGMLAQALFIGPSEAEEIRHREKVEEIIEFFELERYRRMPVGSLSYGIQKLVGLARAAAAEPQLLLLDEPSSGMNRDEKENLARFMLRLKHETTLAMLWVEHDMQMVMDLADSVVVLDHGQKIAEGSARAVAADPLVVEAFLGHAAAGSGRDVGYVSRRQSESAFRNQEVT